MTKGRKVEASYICLDIEKYTNRDVDAQLEIRGVLDDIVRECVAEEPVLAGKDRLMYLPTGDGMCIALLDIPSDKDPIYLRLALRILKRVREYKSSAPYRQWEFDVRVGIHSATDYVVKDINNWDNLAGSGINTAFRIMGIADGGQILLSKEVFSDLVRQLPHQFKPPYVVKVRHDLPLTVYQYNGEADGLNKDVPLAVERQRRRRQVDEAIAQPAADLGLCCVYAFRNDEVVRDLREDISGAQSRVWLLGIGLHDRFDIADEKLIELLKRKMAERPKLDEDKKLDVRILLLDGFRSPAVFRALLESDAETSRAIITADRELPDPKHPYLAHRVFVNFERAYEALAAHPEFETAVRFYGHTPICWLAIVDDRAYFQPYTFGDISANPSVGFQMPVTRWEGRTTTLVILEDHYNKLWLTSDTDLFLIGTRLKARAETLWTTFRRREGGGDKSREEDRGKWFEHVHGTLHKKEQPGLDRRTHLRLPCVSMRLEATISWKTPDGEIGEVTKAKPLDFSLEGIRLKLIGRTVDSPLFKSLPEHHSMSSQEIFGMIEIEPKGGWEAFEERQKKKKKVAGMPPYESVWHAVSAVVKTDNNFRYIRKEKGEPVVALQAWRVKKS
jgi:hypothetical protein